MSDGYARDVIEIVSVAARLSQAADDRNVDSYANCLAATIDDGAGAHVEAAAYARDAIARVSAMDWTHHKLVNPVVAVDADGASALIDVVIDMGLQTPTAFRHASVGGRYDLGLIRVGGAWRIERRTLRRRYVLGDAALAGE